MKIEFLKLEHGMDLDLPSYATEQAAGMDLRAAVSEDFVLSPGARALIPTGLVLILSKGFEAQIRPRSGLAFKNGVSVLNAPGTIDSDYRGEIQVLLINHGQEDFVIERGMRIAQMVIASYQAVQSVEVYSLESTEVTQRAQGGFGSTGVN